MNATEFRDALRKLGVSQTRFARSVNMDVTTINRWATGLRTMPGIADAYIRLLVKIHDLTDE